MKLRPTFLFGFCLTVVLFSSGIAFAQTPAPTPTVITPQTAIVAILAVIVGYIGQAVNSGSIFGITTTPQAWIPYLTLLGSFLGAFGLSLQGASTLNGAAWFNAAIAGLTALLSAAGGSAAHSHFQTYKVTMAKRASAVTEPPPPPPPAPKA
jgi:CDP-diglyceride synthetase